VKALQIQQRTLFLLIGIFASIYVVSAVELLVYAGLALHALRGPRQAIESLSLMFVLLMANPGVISGSGKSLRWGVLIAGFGGTLLHAASNTTKKDSQSNPIVTYIWIFFLIMLPVSLFTSKIAVVSTFKLLSFFMGTFTILYCFRQTQYLKDHWKNWFTTIFTFMTVGSFLILPLGLGYLRNGSGFQGLFNHPQTMGPVGAIMATWFLGIYLFSREKKSIWYLVMGGLCIFFIFLSQARIGLAMMAGGFVFAYLAFIGSGKIVRIPRAGKNMIALSVFAFLVLLAYDASSITNFFTEFLQKRTEGAELSEVVYESRGFLIAASMQNFYDFPVFGIGFGVPTDYESGFRNMSTFMGIPTGASIEKGFMPSAVLEETGLIGATLTIILIATLIITVNRKHQFHVLWLLMTTLLLNVGEAVLFSFGGLGLFAWLMFGFSYNQAIYSNQKIIPKITHEDIEHRRRAS